MSGEFVARVKRILDASVEDVYDAWMTPDIFAEWIAEGGALIRADMRVGGEFLIEMGCGGEKTSPHSGVYRILNRPNTIEFTWLSAWTDGESVVHIELSAVGNQTLFELEHRGLSDQANADDHQAGWDEFALKAISTLRSYQTKKSAG